MTQDRTSTIERKCGGSPALRGLWNAAVSRLQTSGADANTIDLFLDKARHPRELEALAKLLANTQASGESPTDTLKEFFVSVNESRASLSEWLAALAELQAWLSSRGRRATLTRATGYIECCTAATDSAFATEDLPANVVSMLETYGFEEAND